MCNHFQLAPLSETKKYLLDLGLPLQAPKFTQEELAIFPKKTAPVLLYADDKLQLGPKSWGFPSPYNEKQVIFNARIERFYEKRPSMWDDSFARKRCLIVARSFFEKKGQATYSFSGPEPLTLIAGIYQDDHFSMVTTKPNQIMAPIHDRMPLVIAPSELRRWLFQNFTSLIDRSTFPLRKTMVQ
jgi:putative SOS response-associated peptidase YedK